MLYLVYDCMVSKPTDRNNGQNKKLDQLKGKAHMEPHLEFVKMYQIVKLIIDRAKAKGPKTDNVSKCKILRNI